MKLPIMILLQGFVISFVARNAIALPTTEEFSGILQTCAAGSQIELDADLQGSIAGMYEADRTTGKLSFSNVSKFLELLPKEHRLEGYKLYTECISKVLTPYPNLTNEGSDNIRTVQPKPEKYEELTLKSGVPWSTPDHSGSLVISKKLYKN